MGGHLHGARRHAPLKQQGDHPLCLRYGLEARDCARLPYILGETSTQVATPFKELSQQQLAIIGHAISAKSGPCTTSVSVPWTFVYNGSDSGPLSGCAPRCDSCCCEDIRSMNALCSMASVTPGTRFLMISGDSKPHSWWPYRLLPVFSGNRHVQGGGIVAPMQSLRFFEDVVLRPRKSPMPFAQKMDMLFWRGDSTGFEPGQSRQRPRFIHELRQLGHEVGFYKWPLDDVDVPSKVAVNETWNIYYEIQRNTSGHVVALYSHELNATVISRSDVPGWVPMQEQLAYKYLLCLEGNSIATAILWMLASDSVVIMPPPTQEGWALEGRLRPWVHYVPLQSPKHIDGVLDWLRERGLRRGEEIIRNANRFVRNVLRAAPSCTDKVFPSWKWKEARDGPFQEARDMLRVLGCLVDPRLARALIDYAEGGLTSFWRAATSKGHDEDEPVRWLRRAALRAARQMSADEAALALIDQFAWKAPVEALG